ncbi:MAG: Stp1/IreP family PP2C-type Ser/Thr phosphatase [Myxococcota bacterium]
MDLQYWAGTDVGRKRSDNEDNFLIDKDLRLFVVADGMGGHASGEVASAMAVHRVREVVAAERDILEAYNDDDPRCHVEVCTLLEYAVHEACQAIFDKAKVEPEKRGMGTTIVVLFIIGNRGFIAYVGDSRIYLLRGGVVYQLTEDHSLRNELIRMGKISEDEFESSPYAKLKNAMTRAVGVYESVEVDTLDFDIIAGDSFLMCSDGLYEYLHENDIANAIGLPEIQEIPGQLIEIANTRGGKDNITAIVVQSVGDDAAHERAAEVNFTLDTLKQVPLFSELSYQQLVRMMNLSSLRPISAAEMIYERGDVGRDMFVVLKGAVKLVSGDVTVAELGPGDHFGELGLLEDAPRSTGARVTQTGKALRISRREFRQILRKEPPLAVKLMWSFVQALGTRLRVTTDELRDARSALLAAVPPDAVAAPEGIPPDLSGETQIADLGSGEPKPDAAVAQVVDQVVDMTGEIELSSSD